MADDALTSSKPDQAPAEAQRVRRPRRDEVVTDQVHVDLGRRLEDHHAASAALVQSARA